ncbi:unnamed protein product, partial [Ilex paraguariensis]
MGIMIGVWLLGISTNTYRVIVSVLNIVFHVYTINRRDGFNADCTQTRNKLIGASRPRDRDVTKGETTSRINETNIKDHDAF